MTAFKKQGNTVTFTGATSAPTPVQATASTTCYQYRIINSGSTLVFMGVGSTSSEATTNAVVGAGAGIPILPGTDEILSFVSGAYFTGITSSNTSVIYITPGEGE